MKHYWVSVGWIVIELLCLDAFSMSTRIMPLGDSITQGKAGRASYRYWLWNQLNSFGYDVDFVGSTTNNFNGPPFPEAFDRDHEGHWGWRTDEILVEISSWATATQPDIVLIHLGHNDIWQGQTISSTTNELSQLIQILQTVNSKVTVLLAQVIPSTPSALAALPTFNAAIPQVAANTTTPESRVIVVDHFAGFDPFVDTYDGVHPNAVGEQKMAEQWISALQTILGSPPNISLTFPVEGSLLEMRE